MQLVTFDPVTAPERAERTWKLLEREAAPTFFLSWGWIGTWLRTLPARARVRLCVIRERGEDVAAFFLGDRFIVRHHVVPSRALFLNQAGLDEDETLFIEHNGVLARPSFRMDWEWLFSELGRSWDEVFLNGLPPDAAPSLGDFGDHVVLEQRRVPSPYIDLSRVRASAQGYPALLGKGPRGQVTRSRRLYAERGELRVEFAREPSEALAIFDELVELHRASWKERGGAGAFDSPHMQLFHRTLIREHAASGGAQLVRVQAGGQTIGCLYSFVANGHVAFYQSGLRREQDNRLKPGLTCHAEAIAENARLGHRVYDFLGGTSRYKSDLATDEGAMLWLRVARKRRRFWLEDRARDARDLWRRRFGAQTPASPAEATSPEPPSGTA